MKDINKGTYPTMITPYHDDNTVDYEAVKNITNWYIDNGCTGIFAVCQSSEMIYLSLDEKIKIAKNGCRNGQGKRKERFCCCFGAQF